MIIYLPVHHLKDGTMYIDDESLTNEEKNLLLSISDKFKKVACEKLAPVNTWPLPDGSILTSDGWKPPKR